MQKITKNVDALGFDKWQIADVKRAYASNKTTYTKMNRLAEKIKALGEQYEQLKRELAESPHNGLEEYLFAIAIEDILNANGDSAFNGDSRPSTGKEYLEFLEDESK